jgi:3-deoxy-manno-octulosonate cytidylyltransferase (CMP-KDO synthetase)
VSGPGALLVIPARLHSTRLPDKVLLRETGKYLIEHVWEQARRVRRAGEVLVATDHERVKSAVESFGGKAVLTSPGHRSGSDRVAEVARGTDAEIVVNLQGDEPEFDPEDVDRLIEVMESEPEVEMATLVHGDVTDEEQADPALVKAVVEGDWAVDFVRGPTRRRAAGHLGIYAFRAAFLQEFTSLDPTPEEEARRLEQLRALGHGHRIRAVWARGRFSGIDTPQDYAAFVRRARNS